MSSTVNVNDYILDFSIAHVLSVIYSSKASVRMIKGEAYNNLDFMFMTVPPTVALYEKAISRKGNLDSISGKEEASLTTTGYSIQVLSKLYDALQNMRTDNTPSEFLKEIRSMAILQLQYAIEYLAEYSPSISDMTAVLDGGITFIKGSIGSTTDYSSEFNIEINNLYSKLASRLDIGHLSTMDLAHSAKTWSLRNSLYGNTGSNNNSRDPLLSSIVLELLNRKNSIGLFYGSNDTNISLSLGKQFYILNTLLISYPYVMLDNVLDEIFGLFTRLYNVSYNEAFNLFAFQRKNISYSPFDLGAIISTLSSVGKFPLENSQREIIQGLSETYMKLIMDCYDIKFQGVTNKLSRWYEISKRQGRSSTVSNLFPTPIFPKRVKIGSPDLDIFYRTNGIINQADLLFLSLSLLDQINIDSKSDNDSIDEDVDLSALHLIKTLFDLFS